MLVSEERGKPECPEKKDENQQQTQPTYDGESGKRVLVGGECSRHCAIPAPLRKCALVLRCYFGGTVV